MVETALLLLKYPDNYLCSTFYEYSYYLKNESIPDLLNTVF